MLILTRKSGEKIRIGKDIIISIVENSTGQVKLGIEAPQHIPVHREEIYNQIQAENQAALVSERFTTKLLDSISSRYR